MKTLQRESSFETLTVCLFRTEIPTAYSCHTNKNWQALECTTGSRDSALRLARASPSPVPPPVGKKKKQWWRNWGLLTRSMPGQTWSFCNSLCAIRPATLRGKRAWANDLWGQRRCFGLTQTKKYLVSSICRFELPRTAPQQLRASFFAHRVSIARAVLVPTNCSEQFWTGK